VSESYVSYEGLVSEKVSSSLVAVAVSSSSSCQSEANRRLLDDPVPKPLDSEAEVSLEGAEVEFMLVDDS
jgi:hypothetical protein